MMNESTVRAEATRQGYRVKKSRQRNHVPNVDNHGDFMLLDNRNCVVLGDRFDATLDQIYSWLTD